MNWLRIIVVICSISILGSQSMAENAGYSKSRLERLSNRLAVMDISSDSCYVMSYKGYPIRIRYINNSFCHIGIDIFGDKIKQGIGLPLYNFIEQYLLDLLTEETKSDRQRRMFDDHVMILGDLKKIPLLNVSDSIEISSSFNQTDGYCFNWSDGRSKFSISFPANIQLISGLDKVELENNFIKKVSSHKPSIDMDFIIQGEATRLNNDLYVIKKGYYIIEQMENSRYLTPCDSSILSSLGDSVTYSLQFKALCNPKYPKESLHNLLSVPEIKNDYTAIVKVNKYGFIQENYTCPLSQLISFCIAEGCEPFVGIEKAKDDTIIAVLNMVQPILGYIHLFKIVFNPQTLMCRSGDINVTADVYMPTHNLLNLYADETM